MIKGESKIVTGEIPNAINTANNIVNSKTKWTWKRILLTIFTLYFLIIIIKYIGIFIWKTLNWIRVYIHDLTDEKIFGRVVFYTFVGLIGGILLGVFLRERFIELWEWVSNFWKNTILPLGG